MNTALEPFEIEAAVAQLLAGGVVAVPTESYFALAVDADQPRAIEALCALKGRELGKGIGLMVPSIDEWRSRVSGVSACAERLAACFWPGPLTLVLPSREGCDPRLVVDGTLGVRVPGPSPALDLTRAFGGALTATSANLAGEPPGCFARDLHLRFTEAIAERRLLVVGDAAPGGAVSTLVSVDGDRLQLLRPGALPFDVIERAARQAE